MVAIRQINGGGSFFLQPVGQSVVFDMAVGDDDMFQPLKGEVFLQVMLCLLQRRAAVKQDEFTIDVEAVAVNRSDQVWRVKGMLSGNHDKSLI